MKARATPSIALRMSNNAGGYYFMSLHSGKPIHSYKWDVLPIDEYVKEWVKALEKDEEQLAKDSGSAEKKIEERLIIAYKRVRENARNGLAVVTIQRDSCGGCFNKIPPQRQLDIRMRKKVIVCEHCGRILVDPEIDPNYVAPVVEEKPKRKTRRKKVVEA